MGLTSSLGFFNQEFFFVRKMPLYYTEPPKDFYLKILWMIQFMQSRIRILNFEVLKKFKVSNAVWYIPPPSIYRGGREKNTV